MSYSTTDGKRVRGAAGSTSRSADAVHAGLPSFACWPSPTIGGLHKSVCRRINTATMNMTSQHQHRIPQTH